jgi:hypothetical protein
MKTSLYNNNAEETLSVQGKVMDEIVDKALLPIFELAVANNYSLRDLVNIIVIAADVIAAENCIRLGIKERQAEREKLASCDVSRVKLAKPEDWCKMFGVEVIDPDGWQGTKPDWDTPITLDMFKSRFVVSTTRVSDKAQYKRNMHLF